MYCIGFGIKQSIYIEQALTSIYCDAQEHSDKNFAYRVVLVSFQTIGYRQRSSTGMTDSFQLPVQVQFNSMLLIRNTG
jgi:hypothetical protein